LEKEGVLCISPVSFLPLTRRSVCGSGMAPRSSAARCASAVLIASLLLTAVLPSAVTAASSATMTPIRHVVIITMENHSFDNIFGAYPSGGTSANAGITSQLTVPENLLTGGELSNLTAVSPGVFSTPNPVEGYTAYHLDWNGGKMNGFRSNSGSQSMTYYTSSQLAIEWDLAEEYAIGDMYFSSALTATMPNRLYGIAGFSPVINDYGPPPYIPFSETIFSELNRYHVSWGYYVYDPSLGTIILDYVYGISAYSSDIRSWTTFLGELQNNTLPAVSYIEPIGLGVTGYSQHPSDNMLAGELWLTLILQKIMYSPEWNSTAVFINYDEGGGFYDNVPPPSVDGQQLGFRVPLILVSPYAKEDYISNTPMNHASLIAFIDYNWNMPPLNEFVSLSDIPLDMFTFYSSSGTLPRPPINLNFASLQMPVSLHFPISALPSSSLSGAFPVKPQFPLSSLPYSRTGSSDFSLGLMHQPLYVAHDTSYVPFFESGSFVAVSVIALSLAAVAVYYRKGLNS
jgi:phospholipase C